MTAKAVPDGEEKVRNAIAFFASEYERLTQKALTVSFVHTYLTLLDHVSQQKVGRPVFGRHFRRIARTLTEPWGSEESRNNCFVLTLEGGEYVINATKEPDLGHFSSFELDEMKRLVELNALRRVLHSRFSSLETDGARRLEGVNADFIEDTGEETRPAIKNVMTDVSEYSSTTKRKEVGEMTGLSMLMEKYETRLNELETQMTEVKRKLETVVEALRLLKEEGLLEDEPQPRWP